MNNHNKHLEMLQRMATKSIIDGNSEVWSMNPELSEAVILERSRKIAEFILKQRHT